MRCFDCVASPDCVEDCAVFGCDIDQRGIRMPDGLLDFAVHLPEDVHQLSENLIVERCVEAAVEGRPPRGLEPSVKHGIW